MPPRCFDRRRFRAARRAADLTQREVAQALGLAAATVATWEAGGSVPPGERLPALAQVLGVSLEALFPRSGPPDLADLRQDAGYAQGATKVITGTRSADGVLKAERGRRRLPDAFVSLLATAYGVSQAQLLAAQDRSFGAEPQPDGPPAPGSLADKIQSLLAETPRNDTELAEAVNREAGAVLVTAAGVGHLRSGTTAEAHPELLEALARVLGVPPQYLLPEQDAVRALAAQVEELAAFRRGDVTIAARGSGEVSPQLIAFIDQLLDEVERGELPGTGPEGERD